MLTEEQDQIVHSDHKHLKVLSAAGSGKTTVLTARIAQLCHNGGKPEGILAITVTRRAGKELKERLSDEHKACTVGTFHSTILKVLQDEGHRLNVISEQESDYIIERCATSLGLRVKGKYKKGVSLKSLKKEIRAVRCGDKEATAMSRMYLSKLAVNGDIDFDGLLVEGVRLAQEGAFDWVEHLFVDEAQDNEPLQWQLVMEIAKKASVMVVGDIGQSLYSFRGAEPELFNKLQWPALNMTQSFRFPCNIAEVSNRIGATPLQVVSSKPSVPISILDANVADLVRHISKDRDLTDIAVLCRYNRQVEQVRADLMSAGIPVVVPMIIWRGPVHDLLACFAAPGSATARQKVISSWTDARPKILQYISSTLSQQSLSSMIREYISNCGNTVQQVLGSLSIPDSRIPEAVSIVKEYGMLSVEEYLAETAEQEWIAEGNGVQVGTVHWSKGGEWPEVILPFMDRGTWPMRETPEELRVLYVACTRTKENLHILHGKNPSDFVNFFRN
jgi:superfamily I DNA/RNA helicase